MGAKLSRRHLDAATAEIGQLTREFGDDRLWAMNADFAVAYESAERKAARMVAIVVAVLILAVVSFVAVNKALHQPPASLPTGSPRP